MIPPVSADKIAEAMQQFDTQLRNTQEWANWEQNQVHNYAIEHHGIRYPVKQVVSLAAVIPVSDFSGGEGAGQANQYVMQLGFEVVQLRSRNPTWHRDELILALDLYLRHRRSPLSKGSEEINELSETLNRLGPYLHQHRFDRYRNPNGVYMKLMNFRRFDPEYTASGKVGLRRGGKDEELVWQEFADDPARCQEVAQSIRTAIQGDGEGTFVAQEIDDDETAEAPEGRILTRLHRSRERNRQLVDRKKKAVLKAKGRLTCEACNFDFHQTYGKRGKGFIECHHIKPVHTLKPGDKTHLNDLRLVCSNCHRMIHTRRPWLSMEELRGILSA